MNYVSSSEWILTKTNYFKHNLAEVQLREQVKRLNKNGTKKTAYLSNHTWFKLSIVFMPKGTLSQRDNQEMELKRQTSPKEIKIKLHKDQNDDIRTKNFDLQ